MVVKRIRYLTDAELEIMRVIWDSDRPMDSTQIQKLLTCRSWALSTLMGALKRLEIKEYVKRDNSGYRIMYSFNISEIQYLESVLLNMRDVHNILGMKPSKIVKSLYERNILSIEDIMQLKSCLDNIVKNTE